MSPVKNRQGLPLFQDWKSLAKGYDSMRIYKNLHARAKKMHAREKLYKKYLT